MLSECVALADKAAALVERAQRAASNTRGLRGGDRVWTPLPASVEFSQGQAPATNMVFNVPADADFWAYRLLFYPYCKVIDPVFGTPNEIVWRSTGFTGEAMSAGISAPATNYSSFNTLVDGTFAIMYDGKELQNVETPLSAAYCANTDKWAAKLALNAAFVWSAASQTPGGLVFPIPFFIPRGKALTVRVTPTYLGIRTIVETITVEAAPQEIVRQHRYKIVGVLEGEKKVAALR